MDKNGKYSIRIKVHENKDPKNHFRRNIKKFGHEEDKINAMKKYNNYAIKFYGENYKEIN